MSSPVFGVTGWKNSGKTTLVTRLVSELAGRGFVVSTVKHAHHAFDIDKAGTDSHRHREAGAQEVRSSRCTRSRSSRFRLVEGIVHDRLARDVFVVGKDLVNRARIRLGFVAPSKVS